MEQYLQFFILIPFLGFVISLFINQHKEALLSGVAIGTVGIHLASLVLLTVLWIMQGSQTLDIKHYTFYKEDNVEIFINYFFDRYSAFFSLVGSAITLMVAIFSRYYLHRDSGFKRFFNTLLLFYFAYTLIVFSGNFETLFVGWEFLGITSFLLIVFYRERYLPVKNGLKTISLYRLGDICLILALWMSHHIWHENITFVKINDAQLVSEHIQEYYYFALFTGLMFIISSAIKSAQVPFSSYLPRAMEGPTTSSAVFYGSLSVHLGVFLLLRTYPYWSAILALKIVVIGIGASTAIICAFIARVQSSVKTQIAYGSAAQIGIMFVEVALGFHTLVLFHFAGNAFLRTYQLLVSPSVLGYLVHDQFFNYAPKQIGEQISFMSKVRNSIYVISLKEWHMDGFQFKTLWQPAKFLGSKLNFLTHKFTIIVLSCLYIVGVYLSYRSDIIEANMSYDLHLLFAGIGTLFILRSFTERGKAKAAWLMLIASQFFIILGIAYLNDKYEYLEIIIYVSGLLFSAILGYYALTQLEKKESDISLNSFKGHIHEHPRLAFLFLISCLGFVGLPFTPSFIGIDLLFTHIDKDEYVLITLCTISFLFIEVAALRIYARVFLGQHVKKYHPIAYRSS